MTARKSRMPKPLRYLFALTVWLPVHLSDRIQGVKPPASLARGLDWARTGDFTPPARPRPAPARMTTPAERTPLYAAYAAARQRGEAIGYRCEDDSIIQHAVKAYETAEMARLRAQVAEGFAVADEMAAASQDPLTTAYATQLRQRLQQAGPDTGSNPSEAREGR